MNERVVWLQSRLGRVQGIDNQHRIQGRDEAVIIDVIVGVSAAGRGTRARSLLVQVIDDQDRIEG